MALIPGARLGPYEIVALLGVGGMGEVYRATDTNLKRQVAIKVLPATLATDLDRLARFQREAEVLAALNHPNIAHIHGLEKSDGTIALVMELVEGPTLADRIAQGAIPLADALPIAKQIAEALEAAHEQGIIHRDLKPANIKVREDGTVKVLDFGLAKAMDPAGASSANAMNSPTLSMHATQAGIILGTAAYMSPEQAASKPVDRRSDLWAFGVVLLEMLTGRQVFDGETVSHVIAAVLTKEPEWTSLPSSTPAPIRQLLRRCLEKDRKRRIDSAADARLEIDDTLTGFSADDVVVNRAAHLPRWRMLLPWVVTAAALAIAGALAWTRVDPGQPTAVHAFLDAPADHVLGDDDAFLRYPTRPPMAFTPDGRALVILATREGKSQLFLRSLERQDTRPIAGTDEARMPFVSPDGKWVGFWAKDELRRVPIEGGAVTTVCPLMAGPLGPFGAAWGPGDAIIFGDVPSGRIMRVSANGGAPVAVTAKPPVSSRRRHVAPIFLPDGRRIIFADASTQDASDSRLMVQALDGGEARLVVSLATDARLLPSGSLAFMRLATLMTMPFDVRRAEATGDAVAAMRDVMQTGTIRRAGTSNPGLGMFAVSSLGTLAAIRGGLTGAPENSLVWVARDGRLSSAEPAMGAPAGTRMNARISPDQSRAIVTVFTPMRQELWLADWTRNVWTPCGDCSSELGVVVWSPDGRRLLLGRDGTLVAHMLDGSVPDQVLVREADRSLMPAAWLADGSVAYMSSPDLAGYEIKFLEAGASAGRVIVPLGVGFQADVSHDGRLLAYATGRPGNVIVQTFPGEGARIQVSAGGGSAPLWAPDGRTLYYTGSPAASGVLMAADISVVGGLKAGTPRLVQKIGASCLPMRCEDLSPDGQRFLVRDTAQEPRAAIAARRDPITRMDLVLNWTATLAKSR